MITGLVGVAGATTVKTLLLGAVGRGGRMICGFCRTGGGGVTAAGVVVTFGAVGAVFSGSLIFAELNISEELTGVVAPDFTGALGVVRDTGSAEITAGDSGISWVGSGSEAIS